MTYSSFLTPQALSLGASSLPPPASLSSPPLCHRCPQHRHQGHRQPHQHNHDHHHHGPIAVTSTITGSITIENLRLSQRDRALEAQYLTGSPQPPARKGSPFHPGEARLPEAGHLPREAMAGVTPGVILGNLAPACTEGGPETLFWVSRRRAVGGVELSGELGESHSACAFNISKLGLESTQLGDSLPAISVNPPGCPLKEVLTTLPQGWGIE